MSRPERSDPPRRDADRKPGMWQGRRIVSQHRIDASPAPRAQVDEATDYGYFLWLKSFASLGGAAQAAAMMSGMGGSKVVILRDLDMVVVFTTTDFAAHGAGRLPEKPPSELVLPAVEN